MTIFQVNNLHRQVLHDEAREGVPKAISAKLSALRMRSDAKIDAFVTRFTRHNALQLVERFDVVLDATDNVATRYLVNDACVIANK